MKLADVETLEDFDIIFNENNLKTAQEKIDYLKKEMGVRASRGPCNETPEEELTGLEDIALSKLWIGMR